MDDLNGILAVLILLLDVLAIVQVWRTRI